MSHLSWNIPFGQRRISILLLVVGILCAYSILGDSRSSRKTSSPPLQTDIMYPFQYGEQTLEAVDPSWRITEQAFAGYVEIDPEPTAAQEYSVKQIAAQSSRYYETQPTLAQPTSNVPTELMDMTANESKVTLLPDIEANDGSSIVSEAVEKISQTVQEKGFDATAWNALSPESIGAESTDFESASNRLAILESEQTTGAGGTRSESESASEITRQSVGVFPPAVLPFGQHENGRLELATGNTSNLSPSAPNTSLESTALVGELGLTETQLPDGLVNQASLPNASERTNDPTVSDSTEISSIQSTEVQPVAPYELEAAAVYNTAPNSVSNSGSSSFVNPVSNHAVADAPTPRKTALAPATAELLDWWNFQVADPTRPTATVRTLSLSDLIASAVEHSPRIRTLQRLPQISATRIDNAKSVFDPILSLNNKYTDTMDPVGNTLTTGGAPFLQDNIWDSIGRVSKRLDGGSELSFYQKLGFKNSNSNFFTPQDQGTSTVGMDLRVPLRNGSGYEFNRGPVVVAELESSVAWTQYQVDLQQEILDLGTLYWNLQNARAIYLQQRRSVQRAEMILKKLEARVDYDASISQVAQAKAEYSLRINELQNSFQSIVELEISIRERIGDPDLEFVPNVEVIPSQFACDLFDQTNPDLNQLLAEALKNRFELQRDETKIQVADRQVFLSRSGLAPKLDLVFNVYQSSLQGGTGIERAYQQQFSNSPGFSGGLEYELPYGRRSAKAVLRQAELQRMQSADILQIQRNEIIADVQKAFTRWMSAQASYETAKQAVNDMRRSVEQLQLRWEEFAFIEGPVSQGATPSLALDQLLAGQRRLSETEARLANAELNVAITQQGILVATGSLLTSQAVSTDLPTSNPLETKTIDMQQERPRLFPQLRN